MGACNRTAPKNVNEHPEIVYKTDLPWNNCPTTLWFKCQAININFGCLVIVRQSFQMAKCHEIPGPGAGLGNVPGEPSRCGFCGPCGSRSCFPKRVCQEDFSGVIILEYTRMRMKCSIYIYHIMKCMIVLHIISYNHVCMYILCIYIYSNVNGNGNVNVKGKVTVL